MIHFRDLFISLITLLGLVFFPLSAGAVTDELFETGEDAYEEGENASNPLAAVDNTDVRWQYLDLGSDHVNDFYLDGSVMLHPKLKLKYELHYWETDVAGGSEDGWESFRIKPIYFAKEGAWGTTKYRLAIGFEWIKDFRNDDKGIGSGADQIAPLVGLALMPREGTVLIPLVQHFEEYTGENVGQTAFRLIGLQRLPHHLWFKLDAKVPVDWENDNDIPANVELQLGKMFTPAFGAYVDGLFGIGHDRPYDWGAGLGLRFVY